MSGPFRYTCHFSDPLPAEWEPARESLGGKGASLKELTLAGLRVPPGFTISTAACAAYFERHHHWPDALEAEVRAQLARLERETGRTFGAGQRPLLVSVRSGAARSMPGMMDTILNCGLHTGLATTLGDTPVFWRLFMQFVRSFARCVHGLGDDQFPIAQGAGAAPHTREAAFALLEAYARLTGSEFPNDPWLVLQASINAVFASWHSDRAAAYRQRHAIHGLPGTAVNVQQMFPSEVSGVAFTEDPTLLDERRLVIESAYGLGESVVSGDVTPDRFLVRRTDLEIVGTELGRKARQVTALGDGPVAQAETLASATEVASLSPEQVRELAELALRVERHYGHPVDLEWGWANGQFALLQARAIRGLDVARDVELARQEEVHRLRRAAQGGTHLWITHNLGETLRFPTPLTWSLVGPFMSGHGGFGRFYRQLGYRPSPRVCREGFLELIGGRVYADPARLAEMFFSDLPLVYDEAALRRDRRTLDAAPTRFAGDRANADFLTQLPANLRALWQTTRSMRQPAASVKREFEEHVLPTYLNYVERERARDLTQLADAELLAELNFRNTRVLDDFAAASLKPGYFGGLALARLEKRLSQLLGEATGAELAGTLTRALDGDTTFEQDDLLFEVARGRATLAEFLARFGHRCVGEMELAEPRWRQQPEYLEQLLPRLRAAPRTPRAVHAENVARREAAEADLPRRLAEAGGSAFREEIEGALAAARLLLAYREAGKHYLMLGYELLRLVIEELGRRWDLVGDIYYLRLDELAEFPTSRQESLRGEIAQRRVRWQSLQRLDLPEIIESAALDQFGLAPANEPAHAHEFAATPLASGVATGTVRIVHDPRQAGDLGADFVLVCPSTDPGWTPLFLTARALVVERGGVLSHGAIVARDFGIPAVACPAATKTLRHGDRIRVDGNQGRIVVLERGDHA